MAANEFREMIVGIAIVVLSALGLLVIIPVGVIVPDGVEIRALSPDFWPFIVVAAAGLAGATLAVQGLVSWKKATQSDVLQTPDSTKRNEAIDSEQLPLRQAATRVIITIATLFVLYYAIPVIGMVATTIPIAGFLMWYAGERRWKIILPVAIALPLVLYFFFVYVANVPIPLGVFETLS